MREDLRRNNIIKEEKTKRSRALPSLIVAFAIVATLSITILASAPVRTKATLAELLITINPVSQDEIDARRAERDAALAAAEEASAMVDQLSAEAGQLSGELAELNELSAEQMAQYEIIAEQYANALLAKAEALDRFVAAQDNLIATRELFSERVSIMFEYQNKSLLEILLSSDTLAGFFTNMEIITLIADSDAQAIDQMQIALDDAEAQANYALQEAADMEAIAQEKQAQLAELEARIGETSAALDDVNTRLSYQEQLEIENNALAEQLNDEIWQLQQELYAQQSASSGGGGGGFSGGGGNGQLSWPTWTNWITSSYGWRTHPIYGDQRFHAGIDIGAGFGDTIMASASGTVITCYEPYPGCNYGGTGYGNYLVIDHGNGLSTLYAHCRDIYVSNGSYVSAGQAIGEVGSTGGSTGAHLHYEVRVNGSTVDPLSYLP